MVTSVAEPISTAGDKTPSKWTGSPAMMAASAGLGAVLATILVLVWAFSSGPQSVQQPPKSAPTTSPTTAQPVAAKPPEAPAETDASALPDGLGGVPGLTQTGASSGGTNPLAAFTPSAPSSSRGSAPALILPPLPAMPPPPDLQTMLDTVGPYLAPALAPSVISGDAIAGLIGSAGGWVTAAAVATANNTTTLLANLIVASAIVGDGQGPLEVLARASQGMTSLGGFPGLPPPDQMLGLPGALAVSLPALEALGRIGMPQLPPPPTIPMPQLPPIGLPQPPPIGLPQLPEIGLPQLPPIGLPQLPPIGLPQLPPPPPLLLNLF